MARVCVEDFPETNGFYMDGRLKMQIDVLLKNVKYDWDFTILVCGQGEVRVGKSVLAMQIGMYWTSEINKMIRNGKLKGCKEIPFNSKSNVVFEGKELIKKGNYLGEHYKYAVMDFDEAGADLEGKKVMSGSTKDVLDYYRECGQYNMLNILVIPEFFDLPKGLALSRSIFLIDVFYTPNEQGIFERGYYNFYSRKSKKYLYLKGKRDLDYSCVKSDFGKVPPYFPNFYTLNEKEYREEKQQAMKRRETKARDKNLFIRDALFYLICGEGLNCECGLDNKMTQSQLIKRIEGLTGIYIPHQTLSDALRRMGVEVDETKKKKKYIKEREKEDLPRKADADADG